jgi:hypothetical protein
MAIVGDFVARAGTKAAKKIFYLYGLRSCACVSVDFLRAGG